MTDFVEMWKEPLLCWNLAQSGQAVPKKVLAIQAEIIVTRVKAAAETNWWLPDLKVDACAFYAMSVQMRPGSNGSHACHAN